MDHESKRWIETGKTDYQEARDSGRCLAIAFIIAFIGWAFVLAWTAERYL